MPSNKAIRTNAAILQAAREIVRKEGIDRLSMDRVAQQAGLSKGAVMYHFPSKRSLQAALLEDYAEHMDEELHRHEALFEGTSIEKLMAGYAALPATTTGGLRWACSFWASRRLTPSSSSP